MKVSLSLEKSYSNDVSIMVDVLRASTTITIALNHFEQVIPVLNKDDAVQIAKDNEAVIAGERRGTTLEGFDAGNSPIEIQNFQGKTLVLTTSNGTRIMDNMNSKILVGCFTNAQAVAQAAGKLAMNHIEIVMAGVEGRFAIEDFLGAGKIISYLKDEDLDEYAQAALMACENNSKIKNTVLNSRSGRRLMEIGFKDDVDFCLKTNISKNVPFFDKKRLINYNYKKHALF
ncbi:2-phosphosulfolactate phosphatase [Methanobacterium alcaliphilum]|uniref:2-phosphosulfolactate phosphatase n=1 Tax=Methanobacterium alcaliphilum TaxID=392018 RepID=UPI00200AFF7C|nr:2-phosphosulfolactate phosphatase [Methanobacterium alcaliphilum]MCK9151521.1 2-phosphosulfolactate phosphatase [Methanobacterium alcaliphilum]